MKDMDMTMRHLASTMSREIDGAPLRATIAHNLVYREDEILIGGFIRIYEAFRLFHLDIQRRLKIESS